jgi:precorrin-4 C11-methyltransferase
MKQKKDAKIYFIGAGPGDPELLTLKGRRLIRQADVLIYAGSLINPRILSLKKKGAAAYDSASMNLQEMVTLMVREAARGKMIARIHSGDPAMYGAIREQMICLNRKRIPYEVVPGVSSVFAAAAALKKELTVPDLAQTVILTRASGRTNVPGRESLRKLARSQSTMAIFLSVDQIDRVVEELRTAYPAGTPAAVVYRASWPDEKIIRGTLTTIASRVKAAAIKRQAIILVGGAIGECASATPSRLYDEKFTHGFRKCSDGRRKNTAVLALTGQGAQLGRIIARGMPGAHLYVPAKLRMRGTGVRGFKQDLPALFAGLIHDYSGIVCIMAAGIVVRTLSPLLVRKDRDPAVVVVDEKGRFAISLVAGHLGGANELAARIAAITGGTPVVTTATDVQGVFALDLLAQRLRCGGLDFELLKRCSYDLLHGEKVGLYPALLQSMIPEREQRGIRFYRSIKRLLASYCRCKVVMSNRAMIPAGPGKKNGAVIHLRPGNLVIGIGCNRDTPCSEIEQVVTECLERAGCSLQSVARVATVSNKADEKGLLTFVRKHSFALDVFSPARLNRVSCPTPPSPHAMKAVGSKGVCEPAALVSAGVNRLLCPKQKKGNVAVAIAEIPLGRVWEEERGRKD